MKNRKSGNKPKVAYFTASNYCGEMEVWEGDDTLFTNMLTGNFYRNLNSMIVLKGQCEVSTAAGTVYPDDFSTYYDANKGDHGHGDYSHIPAEVASFASHLRLTNNNFTSRPSGVLDMLVLRRETFTYDYSKILTEAEEEIDPPYEAMLGIHVDSKTFRWELFSEPGFKGARAYTFHNGESSGPHIWGTGICDLQYLPVASARPLPMEPFEANSVQYITVKNSCTHSIKYNVNGPELDLAKTLEPGEQVDLSVGWDGSTLTVRYAGSVATNFHFENDIYHGGCDYISFGTETHYKEAHEGRKADIPLFNFDHSWYYQPQVHVTPEDQSFDIKVSMHSEHLKIYINLVDRDD